MEKKSLLTKGIDKDVFILQNCDELARIKDIIVDDFKVDKRECLFEVEKDYAITRITIPNVIDGCVVEVVFRY